MQRCAFLLIILVLPVAYLIWQVFWDQNSSFLPFEIEAKWVFHPVQEIEDAFHKPVSKPVKFRLDFWVDQDVISGDDFKIQYLAFRAVRELTLNGRRISLDEPLFWKDRRFCELSAWLRNGENTLELIVANSEGIPGLMVEEPSILRTPGRWKAGIGADTNDFRSVVGARQTGPPEPLDKLVGSDPGPLMLWLRETNLTVLVPSWVAAWIGITLLVAVQLVRGRLRACPSEAGRGSKYLDVVGMTILGSGLLWGLSNATQYLPERSPFDFHQHVEYIDYVSEVGLIATPTDGFQMYQPPLYYWLGASVRGGVEASLKRVQYLGALAGWALAVLTWFMARRLMQKASFSRVVAVMFSVSLPMVIYMSPLVTNEVFAAAMIALAFYLLIVISEEGATSWRVLIAGIFAGLAMLSKYSALIVLIAGCLWLFQQWVARRDRSSLGAILIYLGSALLICGWLYTRNQLSYGDPFIMPGDEASGFWYVQQPTYRTASFYYSFGSGFFHHPDRAPWISFGDGHYCSLWGDPFRTFLDAGDEQAYYWFGTLLLLAFAPSCAIFLGLVNSFRACWRRPVANPELLLFSVPVWTLLALVSYSIELPFVSVIKAFFFLFLVPILAIHLVRGRVLFYRYFHPLGWMHDAAFLLVCGISVWLYSYPAQ